MVIYTHKEQGASLDNKGYYMKKQTLPTAIYISGEWHIAEPYNREKYITCEIYGEMADGCKVWVDANGKQYTRQKIYGKYYFVTI